MPANILPQPTPAQTVAATRQYDAFGNVVSSSGTWQGPFGYGGPFGYQEDPTGLKLLGHRLYDSSTGRFLTRDPIKDGRNWYTYCENDPVRRVDPNGREWHDPMVIYVDPKFKGAVIVVGEPRKGAKAASAIVPPGYHSHPGMDVDYIIIVQPDGSQRKHFTWGLATPLNPKEETQYGRVDADGKVSAPGPISDDWWISLIDVIWMRKLNDGLNRWVEPDRMPIPGDPRKT